MHRYGDRHGPSSADVVGERGWEGSTEGSAGVSVARESCMIARSQQRHGVASRLGELTQGLSNSKKVTKIIAQEWA